MHQEQDKRRIARWGIDRPASVRLEGAEKAVECRIKDLSLKGFMIILRQMLPADTFIKLNITLSEDFSFDAEAWIVWHKRAMDKNIYGLYFSKLKDSDKEQIYKFVLKNFAPLVYNKWYKGQEEGGGQMEDRRVFSRFAAELAVKFLDITHNKEGEALTSDISAKGLGMVSSDELKVNTPVELWLQMPDNGAPLYTRGEVVWSRKVGPNKFHAGVSLEKADLMGMSRAMRVI